MAHNTVACHICSTLVLPPTIGCGAPLQRATVGIDSELIPPPAKVKIECNHYDHQIILIIMHELLVMVMLMVVTDMDHLAYPCHKRTCTTIITIAIIIERNGTQVHLMTHEVIMHENRGKLKH